MTTKYHAVAPTADKSTRDCLDPWFFALLNTRRELQPCCWHPSIGTLPVGGALSDLVEGPAMREIRRQLLVGEPNEFCRRCPARPLTDPATLRRRLRSELAMEEGTGPEPSGQLGRQTRRLHSVVVRLRRCGRDRVAALARGWNLVWLRRIAHKFNL
jgi:hypothetical protein